MRMDASSEGHGLHSFSRSVDVIAYATLDEAAMQAARGWPYYPAVSCGQPRADSIRVPVEF